MSKWKSISRYSLVHLLPTSSSKSAPDPKVIFNDFYVKPSSCYSPVRILSTSSSKSVLTVFLRFLREIELSLQSRALFRDYFPRSSRETRETETPSATTAATLPHKNRVARPTVFSNLNSRVPDLSHFPAICVMMWLP